MIPTNYFMPPEWESQSHIWLSWPHRNDQWDTGLVVLEAKFAEITATIARFQKVAINAAAELHPHIFKTLATHGVPKDQVELYDHPTNDVWCRDHGPTFVKHRESGELAIVDWGFNAWGEKFPPFDLDDAIPRQVAASLDLPHISPGMILEGGSIEVNGRGQLLTTESVLLNKNRNPSLSKAHIEAQLRTHLGAQDILWLESGIEGDDTDGHIDDLTRFISDNVILTTIDPGGRNEAVLQRNLERLRTFRTAGGEPFRIETIALPDACLAKDWRLPVLPASYVNFLIINGAVLVPQFDQPKNDQAALDQIASLFPNHEAIGIQCLDLVKEGGSLHCISQQQPRA